MKSKYKSEFPIRPVRKFYTFLGIELEQFDVEYSIKPLDEWINSNTYTEEIIKENIN